MAKKLSAIKRVVMQYIKILEEQGIHAEGVILYGSYAAGTAGEESDIDLVIISSDFARYDFPERLSFLSRATLHIDAPLEAIGYTPDEIQGKEGKSIFWDEIRTKGKVMYKAA